MLQFEPDLNSLCPGMQQPALAQPRLALPPDFLKCSSVQETACFSVREGEPKRSKPAVTALSVLVHAKKQEAQAHVISSAKGTESQPAVLTAALVVDNMIQTVYNVTETWMQCCSRQKADPEMAQDK